jgi:hypothetical protein
VLRCLKPQIVPEPYLIEELERLRRGGRPAERPRLELPLLFPEPVPRRPEGSEPDELDERGVLIIPLGV